MHKMIKTRIFLPLLFLLASCTAIQTNLSAVGSNLSALTGPPQKVSHKTSQPIRHDARLAVLWIGHASALIQIDDKFILTDPVFTNTVGQFSKRLVAPGIDPENLPMLDAVLVSHLHIDHFSPYSLDMIKTRIRQLVMPQGGFVYLPNFAFSASELKTNETLDIGDLKITAVPVIHNGWRYGLDNSWMKTSYTGYIIDYHGIRVFFSGDTAYDAELFQEMGKRYPGIDLALLPVAPVHPREYSKVRHTDPAEAIQIMIDSGARCMIPIHYGTFPESLDQPGEALKLLQQEKTRLGLSDSQVIPLEIGEQKVLIFQPGI
ncbi:MAG: MBL fold metallo-hydrolase [Calditrichales bacterium]|nr:MAG: MBL fold metallo-hydrolase [Calditrichales bacterium]